MKPHQQALPNVENVVVSMEKVAGYALNPHHAAGGNKSKVFESAFGFTQKNAQLLVNQIIENVAAIPATERQMSEFGRVFSVDVPVVGPRGRGYVTTGWILKNGENTPRLTSLRVSKGRK